MSDRTYLEKLLILGAYFLLLTPLFFQQALFHPLISLKTIVFQVVVEILAAVYCYLAIFYPQYRPRLTGISLSLLVLTAAILLSVVFGVDWQRSLWSSPERMTGFFLWLHLVVFFLILVGLKSKINWINFFTFSALISFLAALFPVIHLIFPDIFFDKTFGRLTGTLGNAIFLAIYLLIHIFLALWLASYFYKNNKRVIASLLILISLFNLLVIFLTGTRSVFLGLMTGFLYWIVSYIYGSYRTNGSSYRSYMIYLLVVVVLLLGGFFLTRNQLAFWQNVPLLSRFVGAEALTGAPRFFAWKAVGPAFLERPIFGWGLENFYHAFNKYYEPGLLRHGIGETYFDRAHNVYLEFLATTGLLGFAAYIWLLIMTWRATSRLSEEKIWIRSLLIAYFVHNVFAFDTLTSYLLFFSILAFVETKTAIPKETDSVSVTAPTKLIKLAGLTGLIGLMILPIYFINYRLWLANHWEYHAMNFFVKDDFKSGLPFFEAAINAPNIYQDHIRRELASAIPDFYRQDRPIPKGQELVKISMAILQDVADKHPQHYFFHLTFANAATSAYLIDRSYLEAAEKELTIAEQLSPKRQATFYALSKILSLEGKKDAALTAMKKAVDLDPSVGEPHFYYGLLLLDNNRTAPALEEFKLAKSFSRGSQSAEEARVIGGYFADAEDYDNAIYYFREALEFNPKDLEARIKLGITYYFQGQKDLAKRFIGEVMATQDLTQSSQYKSIKPILQDLGLEK